MKKIEPIIISLAEKLSVDYPYFHPFNLGQMLKPPHPIARLAYYVCMHINPNNHALDAGKATSEMEKECLAEIAGMFSWDAHIGHLTSGGTFANLEALWVAKNIHPDKVVVASELAHYTHERISGVLGLGFEKIPCTSDSVMDISALEAMLKSDKVGTVVATLGSTAMGTVDPLDDILTLRKRYDFRIHIDSAYGGYFKLCRTLSEKNQSGIFQYASC